MLRRLRFPACLIVIGLAVVAADVALGAERLPRLRVLRGDYPQAFFFRAAEGFAANQRITYDRWEATFSRLMGIEGKVLEEELPGRSKRNIDFFSQFKQEHPDQLVLLHYNGNSRDPRYQCEEFFAGHFIYFNGAKILEDVPAEEGETEIKVDNPALFRTEMGRYRWSNEDVGLAELDEGGQPDWHKSEQVQLVSVDSRRKVIVVKRGAYGTKPRAFKAGRAYAAAHVTEGPWGRKSNLLWYYNYATVCPRDAEGRTCNDVHCEDLAARFLPGGRLEAFDGLEFDVMHHQVGGGRGMRGPDCNADGRADNGVIDGVNVYGIGVVEFNRRLRERLGPDRLILADGMSLGNQRAFGILNGIESEGWPHLSDWEIRDWSGGLNRHWFWTQNAHRPVFNYINHKFTTAGPTPGSRRTPEVPFGVHRLVFAAAMFTDSALCYSFAAPKARGEVFGIWDELRKGTEEELGWLGRPMGPAVRLAESGRDLLQCRGDSIRPALVEKFVGEGMTFLPREGGLTVTTEGDEADSLRFRLQGVPCHGPDLFVSVTAAAQPLEGYPKEIARMAWVGIAPPAGRLVLSDPPAAGMCLRGGEETEIVPESGATVRWFPARELGGESHDCYMVHPPYKQAVGYTFWEREVDVPDGGRLEFLTGMGEKSPTRSDGVVFRVLVADVEGNRAGDNERVFEHVQKEFEWMRHKVSLKRWAGRRVRLRFVADCGPKNNATTDHAHWGEATVLGHGGTGAETEPVRYMTWVNEREFTSGFYFQDVRSETVDLEWNVEGTAPITIRSVHAYAHPDAIYREFEHGLVLANPSPRPYEFDLGRLFAGRKFRRLRGSAEQDPATNDGSAVGTTVTLRPKEGLFLVKVR